MNKSQKDFKILIFFNFWIWAQNTKILFQNL